ncbi:UNVERIFIED_CONTAM: Fatty acyl-CoA reductase 2 [Sesamum latifolium]|uniref:Fatty acyl-CoA reductase n=1 Tax=Sesamum latifolium TaxID=2727402 RepID=A0AAW2VU85_9LAMI
MDTYYTHIITEEVDVIIGSAASTNLNDRYDFSLDVNVNAPQHLMRFAKTCKNLKLFVHVSTDVTDEIILAMKSCIASTEYDSTKNLKRLGLERAAFYGWYTTYHMTKAMGEMVINEIRGDVPVLIIRPSVIESSYKEPTPGWIQGNRMFDPVIMSYGKRLLPAYLADPNVHMDIVPVDLVANTIIAAIAKHGIAKKPELNVYHVATDFLNPLRYSEFFDYIHEYFNANPATLSGISIAKMKLFKEFSDFSKYIRDELLQHNGLITNAPADLNKITLQNLQKQYKAKVAYAEQLCKMYEFIGFFKAT